jgi:hypothetical protein
MSTRVINQRMPTNQRNKVNVKQNRKAADVAKPSVIGCRTLTPSTVGLAGIPERRKRIERNAAVVKDALQLVQAATKTGDAALIASAKPLMALILQIVKLMHRTADSIARETALVEGDPDVAAGLIGDNGIHLSYFDGTAIDARNARDAFRTTLGYAIERGDMVEANRLRFGFPEREDRDPYAGLGKRAEIVDADDIRRAAAKPRKFGE